MTAPAEPKRKRGARFTEPSMLLDDLWKAGRDDAIAKKPIDRANLPCSVKAVLSSLMSFRGICPPHQCNPSIRMIGEGAHVWSDVTVQKCLRVLEERDFITITHGEYLPEENKQGPNSYAIHAERGSWTKDYPKRTDLKPRKPRTRRATLASTNDISPGISNCGQQASITDMERPYPDGALSALSSRASGSSDGATLQPDPEPSRRDPASTPDASQDSPSEPDLARGSSASPTEGESSAREAGSFVTSGQSSGLGGSSESSSPNEPADPSDQPSFWGDLEPTSTPCCQSSPSGSGQSSPVPTSQPSARPLITDVADWKRLVHAQGGRDPIIAFTSDQLRTLAYLDVQDEAYWIWRHKQDDWRMTYGTDATWETPEGHPYPPRFPVQAIHFEIAEQKGLSLLQQLEKLRILDPPCRKSWEIALAHHLLTEKTYREQSDADERDFMDSNSPPDVFKERSTVVAGYLEAKKHRRWPEYALQGRSKDDLWALRAKETASLTRAAQRVSNGQIDRVA